SMTKSSSLDSVSDAWLISTPPVDGDRSPSPVRLLIGPRGSGTLGVESPEGFDLLEVVVVEQIPLDPRGVVVTTGDPDGSRRREDPVARRVVRRDRELRVDELVVVDADDDRRVRVDHADVGEDPPFEIEESVSLPEPDPGRRVDRARSGDDEVEPFEGPDEIE